MALVNTGRQRSMTLWVTKAGTDNSSVVLSPTSTPSYPILDGKNAFGSFPIITESEMQELSDADFTSRLNAWKTAVQEYFAESDPDMWDDISGYFKYTTLQVVRIIGAGSTSPLSFKATIFPYTAEETILCRVTDSYTGFSYTLTIAPGSSTSNVAIVEQNSELSLQDIFDNSSATLISSQQGGFMAYKIYVDVTPIYPLPI